MGKILRKTKTLVGWKKIKRRIKRGKKANDAVRHCSCCHNETVMFGNGMASEAVQTTRNALQNAIRHKPRDLLAVNVCACNVAGRDNSSALSKF